MDNIATSSSSEFHAAFDRVWKDLGERVRDDMVEWASGADVTEPKLLGQMLLTSFFAGQADGFDKRRAFDAAEVIGPDWAQALYHAAVFMTKVA